MKWFLRWGTVAFFLFAALLAGVEVVSTQAAVNAPKTARSQLIIKLKGAEKSAGEQSAASVVNKYARVKNVKKEFAGVKKDKKNLFRLPDLGNIFSVEVDAGTPLVQVLERLQRDAQVEYAQLNYIYEPDVTPNDTDYSQQYAYTKLQAPSAWDLTTGTADVAIAIIGTGVKWDHEDLSANIWSNTDEIDANSIDDDGNGYVDDIRGWDFEFDDNDPSDTDGHDTSVAGVAAAVTNNSLGVAGTCWNCKIMPLRVEYTTVDVASALYYAIDNGAKVVNMSFGNYDITKYGPDTTVETAINYGFNNGIIMVATAGNDSTSTLRYPGALTNVIGVASTDSLDKRSSFSNYGDWVDMSAPGTNIRTTSLTGYSSKNGTSFAAPYVSGVAALVMSRFPTLTATDTRAIVEYTVNRLPNTDESMGSGRVNALNAVSTSTRPGPFSIIKKPWHTDLLPLTGTQEIWGSALGDSYVLDYQAEGDAGWTQIATGTEKISQTLGTLDVTNLPSRVYYIRLTTTKATSTDAHTITVFLERSWQTGFPKSLGASPLMAHPIVTDLDGNGDMEIIIGSSGGQIFVVNHDGTALSGWPQATSSFVFGAPAVGDIDGDGDKEVVAAMYGSFSVGGAVAAWHHDGTTVTGWPKAVGQVRGSAMLINMDADAALEVVVAAAGVGAGNALAHAWNGDGTAVSGWPYTLPESNLQTSPAAGDVDGDMEDELVFSTVSYTVILEKNASLLTQFSKSGTSHVSPVLADVDANGKLDILQGEGYEVVARTASGTVKWSASLSGPSSYGQVAVGNVDGSGGPEVFFGSYDSPYKVYGWNATGTVLSGWPKDHSVGLETPTIGDVNGDGSPDIIVANTGGMIYGYNKNGSVLSEFPRGVNSVFQRSVAIADLDADGDTEVIAGANDGTLYVWDLSGSYSSTTQPWPTARRDVKNTGRLPATVGMTGTLFPSSDGAYTQWTPNTGSTHYTLVDESACNGTTDYNWTTTVGNRDAYGVSIASIPDGSTITDIAIKPCASRNSGGGGSATMNVFYRFNGANSSDAGNYALSGTTPVQLATTTYSGLSLAKGAGSTLQIGAVLSAGTKGARLSRIVTTVTYKPPQL